MVRLGRDNPLLSQERLSLFFIFLSSVKALFENVFCSPSLLTRKQ